MSMALLKDGLNQLGLSTSVDLLMDYLTLLQKWNRAYNLTAIKNRDDMITRHVLDSLAIAPFIQGKNLLDVGAGAGLPGVPLAINNPDLQVVLLDSNGKKVRFMQEVKRALKLDNIEVIESRVEQYHPVSLFDTITSRAFSDLNQMLNWTNHLLDPHGIWVAMKGRYPEAELQAVKLPFKVHDYTVPGLEGERCCVIIHNKNKE